MVVARKPKAEAGLLWAVTIVNSTLAAVTTLRRTSRLPEGLIFEPTQVSA